MSKPQKQTIALFSILLAALTLLAAWGNTKVSEGIWTGRVGVEIEHLHQADARQDSILARESHERVKLTEAFNEHCTDKNKALTQMDVNLQMMMREMGLEPIVLEGP